MEMERLGQSLWAFCWDIYLDGRRGDEITRGGPSTYVETRKIRIRGKMIIKIAYFAKKINN
jgi:hypothetical protein